MPPIQCIAVVSSAVLRGLSWTRRGRRWARLSAITLVVDEAVHPIRRHYTL